MKKKELHNGKHLLVIAIFCFQVLAVYGQQLPVYSQYTFNAFLQNPAAAGAEGYTAINTTSKQQWVGIEGAPTTFAISLQTRVMRRNFVQSNASIRRRYHPLRSGRVGLGAYVYKDHVGLLDQTGTEFTYAYHLSGAKSQLSFGLTLSLFQFKLNETDMRLPDQQDKLIDNNPMIMYIPDANIGIYYTNQRLFAGFSMYHLTEASVMFGPYRNNKYRLKRQYNACGGFQIHINETTMIEPSVYLKMSEQWRPQADVVNKIVYDQKLWFGLGYRTPGIIVGSAGCKINRFYLGYAYDYSNNPLTTLSSGTHELMLSIKLGDNVRRYRWMERY